MKNDFNINLYKKSEQSSNSVKTSHEIVRFLMENLLKSMKNMQNCENLSDDFIEKTNDQDKMSKKEVAAFKSKNASKGIFIQTCLFFTSCIGENTLSSSGNCLGNSVFFFSNQSSKYFIKLLIGRFLLEK